MVIKTFAAIYIGAFDITLDIYDISKKNGVECLESLRKHMELGTDTFTRGKISLEKVNDLCDTLEDYVHIAESYQVEVTRAVAASSMREAENSLFILGKIRQRTGLRVEILSNSEYRFYNLMGNAAKGPQFEQLIQENTAVLDVDGGSIQVSLFDKGAMISTINIPMGSIRLRDMLQPMMRDTDHYERLVEEYIEHEMYSFREIHLKKRKIKNVILNGLFVNEKIFAKGLNEKGVITAKSFEKGYESLQKTSDATAAKALGLSNAFVSLMRPTMIIYHTFIRMMNPEILVPHGKNMSMGLAYEYAISTKQMKGSHNFDKDIVSAAKYIAEQYASESKHLENVEMMAMKLFAGTKKIHGMGNREKLLLRITVMLHEVGKYLSLNNYGECAYNIVRSNELIGLSEAEQQMIAFSVRYNVVNFPSYEELVMVSSINKKQYLIIAQMVAILRLANGLDRSHSQKVQEIKTALKDDEIIISLNVNNNYLLERGLIDKETEFFRDVFNVMPVLKVKRKF